MLRGKVLEQAGLFEEVQLCMYKYEDLFSIQLRCMRLIEVVSKKAEKEDLQEAGATVIWPLASAIRKFHFASKKEVEGLIRVGLEASKNLTKNHRGNTLKVQRAGGLQSWLSEDSKILAPDDMPTEYGPTV